MTLVTTREQWRSAVRRRERAALLKRANAASDRLDRILNSSPDDRPAA